MSTDESTITTLFIIVFIVLGIISTFFLAIKSIKYRFVTNFIQKINENPQAWATMVAGDKKDREKIIEELEKVDAIEKLDFVNKDTIDLKTIHKDGSSHLYRVQLAGSKLNPQIISFKRYS